MRGEPITLHLLRLGRARLLCAARAPRPTDKPADVAALDALVRMRPVKHLPSYSELLAGLVTRNAQYTARCFEYFLSTAPCASGGVSGLLFFLLCCAKFS